MLSHGSAFHHHGLTDQVYGGLQITTINSVFVPHAKDQNKKSSIKIQGVIYEFIRVNNNKYFGEEQGWVGDGKFKVTDLERTLLDGLSNPQYCGGMQEVIHAYQDHFDRTNLNKVISYALHLDTAVSRRLGWVLENCLEITQENIVCLAQKDKVGYRLLDPSKKEIGPYDHKWQVRLNHYLNQYIKK